MLLTNVRIAKLTGAQDSAVIICTGLLGTIVPDRPMSFKQESFIVGSGRERLRTDKTNWRVTSDHLGGSPRRFRSRSREDWAARRASRACLFGTVVSRYEEVSWSRHDHNKMVREHKLR